MKEYKLNINAHDFFTYNFEIVNFSKKITFLPIEASYKLQKKTNRLKKTL